MSQSTDATISGLVLDPSGRAIPNAKLIILNETTGAEYASKTDGAGLYTVPILPPGVYRLEVSKDGFKTIIKPGIVLNVQSALALNFTLPVGAASESVTVEAGTAPINTTDASVSTVIDRTFVASMPLNGRSFQDLISMTPGVVTGTPQSPTLRGMSGDFSVNGQRTESNYYTVDGIGANTGGGYPTGGPQSSTGGVVSSSTVLGTTQSLISVDALQEFRVTSSSYSAEFGRAPGGQFALMTRSGTKSFHGGVFEYLRNDFFDANDWFNDLNHISIPALRQNDFGGTLGGPVRFGSLSRDTFFFVSYEGLRLTQPQAATTLYVPDSYMRQDAPAALQKILNAFPEQTSGPLDKDYGTPSNPNLATFIKAYSLPSQIDSTSIRLDHTFSPRWSAFARMEFTPSSTETRSLSALTQRTNRSQSYVVGITASPSSSFDNIFRVGLSSTQSLSTIQLDSFGGATPLAMQEAMGLQSNTDSEASFFLLVPGTGSSGLTVGSPANDGRQWNWVDTLTVVRGRHTLKVGVDFLRIVATVRPAASQVSAGFYSAQAIAANSASTLGAYKYSHASPVFNDTAAFVQDEWRLSHTIGLSLGLRWEVAPAPSEEHGQDAYTVLGNISQPATLTLAPRGTPLFHTGWYNFAPRLGVAWQIHGRPGWETVFRTGGGVFFDSANEVGASGFAGLGFVAYKVYFAAPVPVTPLQLNLSLAVVPPYTSSVVYAFPQHLQLPYSLEWNSSLEQGLGRSQSLTMSYVGSNGRRLLDEQVLSVAAINPLFGTVYYFPNGVTSNYQSLQTKFQRSVAPGLQALVSYSWSHSIDFGSTATSLPLIRGNSDFDVRHNLEAGMTWDLPRLSSAHLVSKIVDDWGIDGRLIAHTAFPVTLEGAYITDPATGLSYYGNVNLIPGKPLYVYGSQYPGGRAINGGPKGVDPAITVPVAPNAGNAPRNFIRGFGISQVNLAFHKSFHLTDKANLQLRAEAFNALNHPNFGYVDPYTTDTSFGTATMMLNQSLTSVASQYQQGGPRSLQFALKINF